MTPNDRHFKKYVRPTGIYRVLRSGWRESRSRSPKKKQRKSPK